MQGMRLPNSLLDPRAASSVSGNQVLLVNCLATWLAAFMTTGINIALPSIQTEFHLSAVALGWLPLGYMLASAVFLMPFSKLADQHGRRLVFIGGVLVFGLSCVGLFFAGSYVPLVIFRVTQGFGGSMIFSTSAALVTLAFPPERRGYAMGINVASAYLGQATGPIFGGIIVYNVGWRSLFLITACLAFLALVLDVWLLRRAEWKEERGSSLDRVGSATYALALSAFLLGLSWVPLTRGIVLFAGGVLGLVFFFYWESRAKNPLIHVNLYRHNRVFTLSNLTALISYSSIWAMSYLISLYLQFIKGLNAETAGLVLIAGVALQFLISPFGGRLSDRVQPRWVASAGAFVCTIGLLLLSFLQTTTPYWYIVLALCIMGVGYGFFSGPNQSAIMGSVEKRYFGFAAASIGTVRMVGMAISVAGATLIMAVIVGRHDIGPADYPHLLTAVRTTFGLYTVVGALSVVASLVRGKMPPLEMPADEVQVPAGEI
jgi:EmrB/QacA subfamily drug resistance transporter